MDASALASVIPAVLKVTAATPAAAAILASAIAGSIAGLGAGIPIRPTNGDDTPQFAAALVTAANAVQFNAILAENIGGVVYDIWPGTYTIKAMEALMSHVAPTHKSYGVWFRGGGLIGTNIIYSPVTPGPMMRNLWWLFPRFSGINFFSTDTTGTSLWMSAEEQQGRSNIQGLTCEDCNWGGDWAGILTCTGQNNNSESKFFRCSVGLFGADLHGGAWLYTPTVANGGTDQILNIIFDTCFFSANNGTWLYMNTGGGVRVVNSDAAWTCSTPMYLFNFMGATHAQGVTMATVNGLRCEHRIYNPTGATPALTNSLLLQSQWSVGTISFRDYNGSSQVGNIPPTDPNTEYVKCDITGGGGLQVLFETSQLPGVHRSITANNNFAHRSVFDYRSCVLLQQTSLAAFSKCTVGPNSGGEPVRTFNGTTCPLANFANNDPANPLVLLDGDMGWPRSAGGRANLRTYNIITGNGGMPTKGQGIYVQIQQDAVVRGARWVSPGVGGGAYGMALQTVGGAQVLSQIQGANSLTAYNQPTDLYHPGSAGVNLVLIDLLNRPDTFPQAQLVLDVLG